MEKITGKNNDIIKGVKKLFTSSKERREQGLFVLEGARLVFDVLHSVYRVKFFFITQSAYDRYKDNADRMIQRSQKAFIISNDISEKLSDTQNAQGIFAVCYMNNSAVDVKEDGKYIALDNVQDPGNLGAIIRTAEALGIDGIFIGGGCDPFNPKVLRSSMGSMLRMSVHEDKTLSAFFESAGKAGLKIYGTTPDSYCRKITDIDFNCGCACIIGNEANGISRETTEKCDALVTIPMLGRAESLNASVAAALTMWEMLR